MWKIQTPPLWTFSTICDIYCLEGSPKIKILEMFDKMIFDLEY